MPKADSYEYAFVIEPDGTGKYYDFTKDSRVPQKHLYDCMPR